MLSIACAPREQSCPSHDAFMREVVHVKLPLCAYVAHRICPLCAKLTIVCCPPCARGGYCMVLPCAKLPASVCQVVYIMVTSCAMLPIALVIMCQGCTLHGATMCQTLPIAWQHCPIADCAMALPCPSPAFAMTSHAISHRGHFGTLRAFKKLKRIF